MQTRYPQNPITKTIAAFVGALAFGLFVAWQDVTATDATAEDTPAEVGALPVAGFGYFPAQFQIQHRADEAVDSNPTF
jgi:hypothetical protein